MTDLGAALFDFGGVIVPGPFAAFTAIAERAGVSAQAVREVNVRNPDTNAWARAERGELNTDEFVAAFADEATELGHALPAQEIVDVVTSLSPRRDTAYPEMLAAVDACRAAGLRVGLVTNNIRAMGDNPDADWVLDTFDTVVESCVEGTRKPEERIYRIALERVGADPATTVMLDDLGINLKTARTLGMRTIKVVDPAAAAAELQDLLNAGRRAPG